MRQFLCLKNPETFSVSLNDLHGNWNAHWMYTGIFFCMFSSGSFKKHWEDCDYNLIHVSSDNQVASISLGTMWLFIFNGCVNGMDKIFSCFLDMHHVRSCFSELMKQSIADAVICYHWTIDSETLIFPCSFHQVGAEYLLGVLRKHQIESCPCQHITCILHCASKAISRIWDPCHRLCLDVGIGVCWEVFLQECPFTVAWLVCWPDGGSS